LLGDLSYTYDNGGRRTGVTGSLVRTALPDALPNAGVDAANRLTVSGPQSLTYDANGNLTGDGSQTYVWNARDQLVQIKDANDVVLASFTYDALGRRQTKIVGGVASGYVYDGANIVQELAGSASNNGNPANVKASYVSGGIDEVFAKQDGSGTGATTLTYLTDALGSTVRLVDAAGAKVVDYTYDPYGNTSTDAAVDNPFQYTGRENDGTGLYYYRARYYSPKLARFISSDPIGLAGGINTYTYVGGNPLSRVDPLGLDWVVSQSTGQVTHVNSSGTSTNVGTGYAGHGAGVNNPNMQNVQGTGPLPQGTYTIETQRNNRTGSGTNLPGSMRLTPSPANTMYGRVGFLIHGDNSRGDRSASEGCVVLNPNIRNQIGSSGDNVLRVVP
jgi:RHS repeat-associated protein